MTDDKNLQAAALALAGSAILGLTDNFVASVAEESGLWQFHVIRTLLALPFLILLGRGMGFSVRPKRLGPFALRSAVVSAGLMLYFAALGTVPVAQAGAGLFNAPVWVLLLSVLVFGARVGPLQVLAVLGGFGGALLVLRPDPSNLSIITVLPMAAGALYGLGMLLTREVCREESPVALTLGVFSAFGLISLGMVCVTFLLPGETFLTRPWTPITSRLLWLAVFQAVGSVIAVTLITQAYRIGIPSRVAVFEYSFLVFAAFWGVILWGVATEAATWIGIAIIIASGLIVAKAPDAKAR